MRFVAPARVTIWRSTKALILLFLASLRLAHQQGAGSPLRPATTGQEEPRNELNRGTHSTTNRAGSSPPADLPRWTATTAAAATATTAAASTTSKLLLLTDGTNIKLFPLDPSGPAPVPTSGHYVLKLIELDPFQESARAALGNGSRYLDWLDFKRAAQHSNGDKANGTAEALGLSPPESGGGGRYGSILPRRRKQGRPSKVEASEEERLYKLAKKWREPNIVQVGHFIDGRFCSQILTDNGPLSGAALESAPGKQMCVVIYWLDAANSIIRLGALQLNETDKFGLGVLHTKFDRDGTTSSSGAGRRALWLQELPPIELPVGACGHHSRLISAEMSGERAASAGSPLLSLLVVSERAAVGGSSAPSADDTTPRGKFPLVFTNLEPNLEANGRPFWWRFQSQLAALGGQCQLGLTDEDSPESGGLINSNTLLYLSNHNTSHAKIIIKDTETNNHAPHTLVDVQWETTKSKVRRMNSNKLNESFNVVAFHMNRRSCSFYWLTSDREIYSIQPTLDGDLFVASAQPLLETKYLGKLAQSGRPPIRPPITRIRLLDDALFFLDATQRSLMFHKLSSSRSLQQSRQFVRSPQSIATRRILAGRPAVPKLERQHQVLLVEMATIRDFHLIDLAGREHHQCSLLLDFVRRKLETSSLLAATTSTFVQPPLTPQSSLLERPQSILSNDEASVKVPVMSRDKLELQATRTRLVDELSARIWEHRTSSFEAATTQLPRTYQHQPEDYLMLLSRLSLAVICSAFVLIFCYRHYKSLQESKSPTADPIVNCYSQGLWAPAEHDTLDCNLCRKQKHHQHLFSSTQVGGETKIIGCG